MLSSENEILELLPIRLKDLMKEKELIGLTEEIRMRVNRFCEIITHNELIETDCFISSSLELLDVIKKATKQSVYAYEKQIVNGYITLKGGHRLGFTGRMLYKDGKPVKIDHFNSINIRFARQIENADKSILPFLISGGSYLSSLIISSPGIGKTTLLREITKNLSGGTLCRSYKVGLIDERGEIASCHEGEPQLDIGPRTDVLDGCDKAKGIMLLIRSMSPEIIVTDEIGTAKDAQALAEAVSCGVKILASCHAHNLEQLIERENMRKIIKAKIFDRYVFIARSNNKLFIEKLYDAKLKEVQIVT